MIRLIVVVVMMAVIAVVSANSDPLDHVNVGIISGIPNWRVGPPGCEGDNCAKPVAICRPVGMDCKWNPGDRPSTCAFPLCV